MTSLERAEMTEGLESVHAFKSKRKKALASAGSVGLTSIRTIHLG